MKKFLAILILVFTLQTPSQADDIRDFQIDGISIEDSALDYFKEKEIKSITKTKYPGDDKFYKIELPSKHDTYETVGFHFQLASLGFSRFSHLVISP